MRITTIWKTLLLCFRLMNIDVRNVFTPGPHPTSLWLPTSVNPPMMDVCPSSRASNMKPLNGMNPFDCSVTVMEIDSMRQKNRLTLTYCIYSNGKMILWHQRMSFVDRGVIVIEQQQNNGLEWGEPIYCNVIAMDNQQY